MKAKIKVALPFIVCLAIQLVVAIIASNVCSVIAAMNLGAEAVDMEKLTAATLELYQGNISMVLSIVHGLNALIMFLWIRKYVKAEPYDKVANSFSGNRVPAFIAAAIGIDCFILGCMNAMETAVPGMFDAYSELMETAGIGQLTFFSVFATVILAPIGEELCFRGLTLRFAKKAGASLLVANIIQAVAFGVMHLNVVQGTYATIMGLLFGYVVIKYNSLAASILMHMVINGLSTLLPLISKGMSDVVYMIVLFVVGVAGLVCFYVLDKKNQAVEVVEVAPVAVEIDETQEEE